ncbi:hypothetical protein ACIBL8_48375 [Streptomyces sp. NPDC050523]|uniref:hypothetical protein n=1 Tax=Streptomyces sp. NPDC050523 TaxID=3365622 RepID=UPI0037ABA4FA
MAANAVGGASAGTLVDEPGGVPWALVLAGVIVVAAAVTAAWPSGPITRADADAKAEQMTPTGTDDDATCPAA